MPTITKNFSKKWLLTLSDSPPPVLTEYRDTDYKYLRVRVTPSGSVSLSVRKAPRGYQNAVRKTLDVQVDEHMPPMSEVRSSAADLVKEIDSGQRKGSKTSLDDAFEEMLKQSDLKPRTVSGYRRNVTVHLEKWLDKPMTGDAKEIVRMHRSIGKKSGDVAANNALRTYRRILKYAAAQGHKVPLWPVDQLRVMGLWSREAPRKGRLERDDFPGYWKALEDLPSMWADLVRFWLLTGCRRREATQLASRDVNFRRKTVTFTDTKNHDDHTLPLTKTLEEILRRRRDEAEGGSLFPCTEPKNISKHLERATGVHVSPHDYRRTFAAVAELAGVGSHTVSVLLNHRSANVTSGYIGRLDHVALRSALQSIEKRILKLAKVVSPEND